MLRPLPRPPRHADRETPGICSLCFAGNGVERGPRPAPRPRKDLDTLPPLAIVPTVARDLYPVCLSSCALGPRPEGVSKSHPNCTQHSTLHRAPRFCKSTPTLHIAPGVFRIHPHTACCTPNSQNAPRHCKSTLTSLSTPTLYPESTEHTPTLQAYPNLTEHPNSAPRIHRMHPDSAQRTLTSQSAPRSAERRARHRPPRPLEEEHGLPHGAPQTEGPAWPASPCGRPCRSLGLGLPLPKCRLSSAALNPHMAVSS